MTASTTDDAMLRMLQAPTRNKYFYGKLLEVRHFQMESWYGRGQRWLMNRIALGSGVMCGLTAALGADGTVGFSPGVVIDGLGREIVVPAAFAVDPAQPTDDCGKASGDKLTTGQSTIYLCYTECDAEPTLVSIADCDGSPSTAAGATVERFRVVVRAGLPATEPAMLTPAQRDAIFPVTPGADFNRLVTAEETLAITYAPPDEACVVLATVALDAPVALDAYTYRPEVFSNSVLFELIAALADRVDACCAAMKVPVQKLDVVDGDNQTAPVDTDLPAPVHLLLTADANPVGDAAVTVYTDEADATLSINGAAAASGSQDVTTAADGTLTVQWHIGTRSGQQMFTAYTAGGASTDVYVTATPLEQASPPVVTAFAPANAGQVEDDWLQKPTLLVTFDRKMDETGLKDSGPWLRAWWVKQPEGKQDEFTLRRLKIVEAQASDGNAEKYLIERPDAGQFEVVVMMLGAAPEIVSAGDGIALDCDYAGTKLTTEQLDQLWDTDTLTVDAAWVDGITPSGTATLPSGDGTPGGKFWHSFFTTNFKQ